MPSDDEIRITAEQNGVQQEFWDNFGNIHATSRGTNVAILNSLGVVPGEDAARAESVPPVMVVLEGEPERIPGTDLWTPNLPLGYHSTHVGGRSMRLIVCPKSAVRLTGKRAGLGVTLYGVRSGRNWGCGDFRDLRDLSSWAAEELSADFIALNPLHAIHNRIPYNQSPYLPNSIFYRNWLYLDVEAVPGYSEIRAAFETPETLAEMARLRATDIVQYEAVAALKRRALEMIFARDGVSSEAAAWIASEGELLRAYATYCALDEHLHAADPEGKGNALKDYISGLHAEDKETYDKNKAKHDKKHDGSNRVADAPGGNVHKCDFLFAIFLIAFRSCIHWAEGRFDG